MQVFLQFFQAGIVFSGKDRNLTHRCSTRVGSVLAEKYKSALKNFVWYKRCSLFIPLVRDKTKFYNIENRTCLMSWTATKFKMGMSSFHF